MNLVNIQRLRVFVEVAKTLSFSRAAERLLLGQPAVSRYVKELEEAIGTRLFDRVGHRVVLTEAGYALLHHSKRVVESVDEMDSAMQSLGDEIGGHLRVGISTVWEYLLPGLVEQFRTVHPKVFLTISVAAPSEVVNLVSENQVHLGFIGDSPEAKGFDVLAVARDELVIIAAPGNELGQKVIRPGEVKTVLPFVHTLAGGSTSRYLSDLGLETVTVAELWSFESVKRGVRSGLGLGMISKHAVREELARGELVQLRFDAPPCERTLYAVRNPARRVSKTQEAFLDYVIRSLGTDLPTP